MNSRILIIDDNPAIHNDFEKILGAESESGLSSPAAEMFLGIEENDLGPKYQLTSAFQGIDGANLVRQSVAQGQPFAVAFVDMRMPPGWDGLRTIKELWKHDENVQIVICTAYSDHCWSEIQSELGRTDRLLILKKPFDSSEVSQLAVALTQKWRLRKELNAALVEARVANEAKSNFVAAMSHELRTPLNGIMGMTQLLAKTELTQKQRRFLSACRSSGESLLNVIGNVLDFSKIEAGHIQLEKQPTHLLSLIEGVVQSSGVEARNKQNVELACFVDASIPATLNADGGKVRQVLFNLIGNSIKFTEAGSISVSAHCKSKTNKQAVVEFTVEDSGIGIPANRLESLFDPFEQVDNSASRPHEGAGLGLHICQRLVHLMGGEINAFSEPNVGSQFKFEIDFEIASPELGSEGHLLNSSELDVQARESSDLRVATTGLSGAAFEATTEMLAHWGISCTKVFLQRAADPVPDLSQFDYLLVDYSDDEFRLQELLAKIKKFCPGCSVKIIPVCNPGCEIAEPTAMALSLETSLMKPVCQSELYQLLGLESGSVAVGNQLEKEWRIAPKNRFRVLIAEDNEINQLYAESLFASVGIEFETCCDGEQAVQLLQKDDDFDLIFMDCQMPIMDGFEASRIITEMASQGITKSIPIIAITANAISGVRERCLGSGMTDYLSKPYTIDDVGTIVQNYGSPGVLVHKSSHRPFSVSLSSHQSVPLDFDELQMRCSNDSELASTLFEKFRGSVESYFKDVPRNLQESDLPLVKECSHKLKGSAATVAAKPIATAAKRLDEAAAQNNLDEVCLLYNQLQSEINRFITWTEEENFSLSFMPQESS